MNKLATGCCNLSWDVVVVETVENANQLQYLALLSYTKRSTNYILERKQSVKCNKYIVCTVRRGIR